MIFEKIKFNTEQECVRQIRLFNYPILEYYTKFNERNKKKHVSLLPILKKRNYSTQTENAQVFYLKINRKDDYTFFNFQHWIGIINNLDADFYIICDNDWLEKEILKRVFFRNKNIKFIKSAKKPLKHIVENITTRCWHKACYAHMTTFWHAKQHNIQNFWNIDADDTMLCVEAYRAAQLLNKVKEEAEKRDISVFSLDMWRSRTNGYHWTFGISYTRGNIDYFKYFENKDFLSWKKQYLDVLDEFNIDAYFNYLGDFQNVNLKSYYFENLYFIHWGRFFIDILFANICYWENGYLYYPILKDVFKNNEMGVVPIASDCIRLDADLTKEYCLNHLIYRMSHIRGFSDKDALFFNIKDTVQMTKNY